MDWSGARGAMADEARGLRRIEGISEKRDAERGMRGSFYGSVDVLGRRENSFEHRLRWRGC